MPIVRRARPNDAEQLHEAHMRSIQELCVTDYTETEILAWGHRPFDKEQRLRAIQNHFVWVVDVDKKVEGYAHLEVYEKNGFKEGYVWGLYLTAKIKGQGFGFELCQRLLETAKAEQVGILRLESSLTAHGFYKRMGFRDAGPMTSVSINGSSIRCIPMAIRLYAS